MIYTSYYGNYKKFPNNPITIQISNSAPFSTRYQIQAVVPDWNTMVKPLKEGQITEKRYTHRYLRQLEANKESILASVRRLDSTKFQGRSPIMLCYCKKGTFCHRNILREWLNKNGIECEEL